MKRFFDMETEEEIYVGTAQEIRALYGSIRRAGCANYLPLFSDFPKLRRERRYELRIDSHGFYDVCRNEVKEPVNKKALARFIRSEVIKRCKDFTARGFENFNHASERSVAINGTVYMQWEKFLRAVETAYEIEGELCLRMGDGIDVWVKSIDHIAVV